MSAQPQKGEQPMEGIHEVAVAVSEQVSQINEGITNLGATAMDVLDEEECTELGISPAGSNGASSWMQQDMKPNLGVTSDAPLQIGEEFPYPIEIALPQFRLDNLGEEAEMALLVRIGLHEFAKWTTKLPEVDPKLVQTFLETYKPPERRAELLKLASILLDVSHVRENFWLPIDGPSVTSLDYLQYNVAQCFQVGVTLREPNEKGVLVELRKVPKDALLPDWKHWVSWVQTYLELDEDSLQVSLGMVRAAMAIRAGHTLNWAKFLTRQLHEAVVAIQKNPNGKFVASQHLTHLIRTLLGPVQLYRVKMIKFKDSAAASEGETSRGQPLLLDPKAELKRRITELQLMVDSPIEAELLLENL